MDKEQAKRMKKMCRYIANRIKRIKSSNETPNDLEQFNSGEFTTVNPKSSSMLMQVLQQASEPPAATSEADAFNQDYDPRDEQTCSQLSGRLRYWYEDPESAEQKRIDKEKVEHQKQQVRAEMIGKFK
ncbi:hypothetical protein [Vibrio harveyi]